MDLMRVRTSGMRFETEPPCSITPTPTTRRPQLEGALFLFSRVGGKGSVGPTCRHSDTREEGTTASSTDAMAKPGGEAAAADAAQETLLLPLPTPCYGIPVGDYQAPPPPPPPPQPPYLIVPLLSPRRRRRRCSALLCSSLLALLAAALLVGAAAFILWPSAPDVRLARVDLRSIRVSASRHGGVALDVDVGVEARVHNPNAFALRYDGVTVEVGYRGRRLGSADAGGALLGAREETYVEARVRVEGVWVLEDTALLIQDMAKGRIPFDAVARVKGRLHLLILGIIPIEGRMSCAINVDVENQIIASQDCYPEKPKD